MSSFFGSGALIYLALRNIEEDLKLWRAEMRAVNEFAYHAPRVMRWSRRSMLASLKATAA
ncbi:hypothetical protein [Herbaspirillum seropedicae]|uniref:hypothetical protein n=1 Tax=Herbaspirillum seropedicae TaxID=964 RepID=UPI003FCDEA27